MRVYSFLSCFGVGSKSRSRSKHAATRPEKPIQILPAPNHTLQPYLPMSPDHKYHISLRADGFGNKAVPVEAYLDPCLKSSLISENKARETNADFITLQEKSTLEDDQGRQYICSFTIRVTWHLTAKPSLSFEETFYVFTPCDVDIDVRLREDIDPHPATVQDRGDGLHPLAVKKDIKKEDKQKQKEYEKQQLAEIEKAKEARRNAADKKYGTGTNGGPPPRTVST